MRISVITHTLDPDIRPKLFKKPPRIYLIQDILDVLSKRGHKVMIAQSLDRLPKADIAVAHVDISVTPSAYVDAFKEYSTVINGQTTDITKRHISENLITASSDWSGKVVSKSNLNAGGYPEQSQNNYAQQQGEPLPYPDAKVVTEYNIFDGIRDVPDEVWADSSLVVEKFLPEKSNDGYALRTWLFMGETDRCMKCVSPEPIVKGRNISHLEPSEVPEEIRKARARLNIDYGKFDFVIHDGTPVLLDANRTPAKIPNLGTSVGNAGESLADGFEALAAKAGL